MGLRLKIILPVVLFGVILIASLLYVLVGTTVDSLGTVIINNGKTLTKSLTQSVQDTLLNRDASTIQGFIDHYREIQYVDYILIMNENGETLAHTFSPSVPAFFHGRKGETIEEGELVVRDVKVEGKRLVEITAPILGGLLGKAYVGMNAREATTKAIRKIIIDGLSAGLVIMLLWIAIMAFLIANRLRPLEKLTKAALSIVSNKNFSLRLPSTKANDEIGQLTSAFGDMIKTIDRHTRDLENTVASRTKELRDNIDKLNTTREQLAFSSKMSALGEMSAGIAHEINNPLGAIMLRAGQIERCFNHPERHSKIPEMAKGITETGERIAKIVSGLRSFARADSNEDTGEVTPVETIINDVVNLSGESFTRQGVSLDISGPVDSLSVHCRPVQVVQVLLNLLNNGKYAAMQNDDRPPSVSVAVVDRDDMVIIRVSDSGPGIPEDIREKILQPFFTTKPVNVGTGLGLSISKGLMEAHGGTLYLDQSATDTTFVIELPKTEQPRLSQSA